MKLNFPEFRFQIKREKNKNYIFDPIRKKYVVLQPEEWVRQHLIAYLRQLNYPSGLMSVERALPSSSKRYDLLVYDSGGKALLIAECKAPRINLNHKIIEQMSSYLLDMPAPFLLLSNGFDHYFFERKENNLIPHKQIPQFSALER